MAHKCNGCVGCRRIDENRVFCRRVRCVKVNRFEQDIKVLQKMEDEIILEPEEITAIEIAVKVLRAEG